MAQRNGCGGRLEGKVAIITGAGTGIGEAIAYKFAHEGARVLLNGLRHDPAPDVAQRIQKRGGEARVYLGDVAEEEEALACVEAAIEEFGRLDVVVNNAGVFLFTGETQDYPITLSDDTLWMNVRSAILMTRFALPHLQKTRGNLLYAGSESGLLGLANNTVYGGTKGFLHAFARGVAVEQARYGVRANCVCPGAVDTAWTHSETGPMTREMEKAMIEATPMGRRGTPEEIANAYAFLASDEASYVTGALFFVDGGLTAAKGAVGGQVPDELRREPPAHFELKHQQEGLKNKPVESTL